MSLVNDMLRDLDARGAGATNEDAPTIVPGFNKRAVPVRILLLGFFSMLLCLLLALWAWRYLQAPIDTVHASAELSTTLGPTETQLVQEVQPVADVSQPVALRSTLPETAATTDNNLPQSESPINEWLVRARVAQATGQLLEPADSSAYYFIQKVLQIAPDQPEALQLLDDISHTLFAQSERAMQGGDNDKARLLLEQAQHLNPDLSTPSTVPIEGIEEVSALASPTSDPAAPELKTGVMATEVKAPKEATVADETVSNTSLQPKVTPSLNTLDQRTLEQARQLVQSGAAQAAMELLNRFLQNQQESGEWPLQSRRYLGELYAQYQQTSNFDQLAQSTEPEVQRAYLLALRAEAQGDFAQALAILVQSADKASADEVYRAKQASLYQRLELNAEAEAHYRRLLESFGYQARYWLGLAIALDRQGEYPSAIQAYREAGRSSDASAQVRRFVNNRLAQLTAN